MLRFCLQEPFILPQPNLVRTSPSLSFFFLWIIEKKMLILERGSMSSSISLWMPTYINKINNRKDLFEFVYKRPFYFHNSALSEPRQAFLFCSKELLKKKMSILAKGLMSNLPSSTISLQMAKYINKINNRKDLFDFFYKSFFYFQNPALSRSHKAFLFCSYEI